MYTAGSVPAPELQIERFVLGPWMTNCYVLRSRGPECWIVDAGFDPEPMVKYVLDNGLEPQQVWLTHAHVDHIAGLETLRNHWDRVPILIHGAEASFLREPELNLSSALAAPLIAPDATGTLVHGQELQLQDARFQVDSDLRACAG